MTVHGSNVRPKLKTWLRNKKVIINLQTHIKYIILFLCKVKDKNSGTGEGRTTCPLYDELDAILGHRAASSPPVVLGSLPEGESPAVAGSGNKHSTPLPVIHCIRVFVHPLFSLCCSLTYLLLHL